MFLSWKFVLPLSFLIFLIIILGVTYYLIRVFRKNKIKTSYAIILDEITKIYADEPEFKIEYVGQKNYDIFYETQYSKNYIKVIFNFRDVEFHVLDENHMIFKNESQKYQKKSSSIPEFIKEDFYDVDKRVKKFVIFYPKITQMLYLYNDYEYRFIYPETDIFGCHFINFNEIEEWSNSKLFD